MIRTRQKDDKLLRLGCTKSLPHHAPQPCPTISMTDMVTTMIMVAMITMTVMTTVTKHNQRSNPYSTSRLNSTRSVP